MSGRYLAWLGTRCPPAQPPAGRARRGGRLRGERGGVARHTARRRRDGAKGGGEGREGGLGWRTRGWPGWPARRGAARAMPRARGKDADVEQRPTLQAVLLADSFAQRFRPITAERPKALLPLANVPMIEYTLEWLASGGVEEVFVFCCAHAKQIVSYIEGSQWANTPKFKVSTIVSYNCLSAGEALRLIEQKNVVRSDFVLVSADTVSTIDLAPIVAAHRERRVKDKLAVMTMCVKHASAATRERRLGEPPLMVATDPETQQVLMYDMETTGRGALALESELFGARDAVEVHADIVDCHIDICAPEVLMLFTDNFDFQQIRSDFVRGLLSDEVLGNKIFLADVGNQYSLRVSNLRAYAAASQDIMQRWSYPYVPDANLLHCEAGDAGATTYSYVRGNVYRESGVIVPRSARLGEDIVIGAGTSLGERCVVESSVIGRDCVIGEGAVLTSCYVHNGARVRAGARLSHCMVCEGATVGENVTVGEGSILSIGVVIADGFTLLPHSRVSCFRQPDDEDGTDDEMEDAVSREIRGGGGVDDGGMQGSAGTESASEVGAGGRGLLWKVDQEAAFASLAPPPQRSLVDVADEERCDTSDEEGGAGFGDDDEDESDVQSDDEDALFLSEVKETFVRGVEQSLSDDNVVLEVGALRLAYNKTWADCAGGVLHAILDMACAQVPPGGANMDMLRALKLVFSKWGRQLKKFVMSEDDEVEMLLVVEEYCDAESERVAASSGPPGITVGGVFAQMLKLMYDDDLFPVSEEAILAWADEKAGADEEDKRYVNKAMPFIKWLQEAEEESSEEDSEEESD